MGKTSRYIQRNWRLLLTIATFIALAAFIYIVRNDIVETVRNLDDVNAWALALIIPLQVANYYALSKLHLEFLEILGNRFALKPMLRLMLELTFVNNIFPSGGVSGISYFGLRMKQWGVSGTKSTLVQIAKFGLIFISFQLLLGLGLVLLALEGKANSFLLLIAGSIATLLLVGTAAVAFIIGSERRIKSFFTYITRALNRVIRVVLPSKPEIINVTKVQSIFTDMHRNYMLLKKDPRQLKMPFVYALVANIAEFGTAYVVYVAFSVPVNPGAVIIAYAVANFAGAVSVLPGGVGIYEALMTTTLVAAGVPAGVSIPVTIMYRILNTAIQLPPGYYFYHKAISKQPAATRSGTKAGEDGQDG